MESFASLEPRIEISACNFTNQTLPANPDSSWLTRYSRWCICRFRSQFSRYFAVMEEWINFEFRIPDFGGILGGNSSSDGVNNQVLYLYTLKTSSNSSSFVTYLLSKSTSENRQNIPKNQASSGQSITLTERKRKCSGCGTLGYTRASKSCPWYGQRLIHSVCGGSGYSTCTSGDAARATTVVAE